MPQRESQSNDEMKARLMKEAEELIDRLLSEKKPAEEITLSDIERTAVGVRKQFGAMVAQQLTTDSQRTKEKPDCPKCGSSMRLKGYRTRRVETEAGEVEVRRANYLCPACGKRVFPPG